MSLPISVDRIESVSSTVSLSSSLCNSKDMCEMCVAITFLLVCVDFFSASLPLDDHNTCLSVSFVSMSLQMCAHCLFYFNVLTLVSFLVYLIFKVIRFRLLTSLFDLRRKS